MKLHTAKKDHTCSACGKKINKGERYWRDFVDGVRDVKEHANCAEYEAKVTASAKGGAA